MANYAQQAVAFTAGDPDRILQDLLTRCAVERCLQIVGEALSRIVALDRAFVWRITDAQKIIAFRHLLTHHYYRVSPMFVAELVETRLPQLQLEVEALLSFNDDGEKI
jgi:uncharacterized protein with HEPN domain